MKSAPFAILCLALAGCSPVEEAPTTSINVYDIDEGQAAGVLGGQIAAQPLGGGETKLQPIPSVVRFAISRDRFVFAGIAGLQPSVGISAGILGAAPVLQLTEGHGAHLARGAGHLAWAFNDEVWLWRPADAAPLKIAGRHAPRAVAVNATHLFWLEPEALYRRAHDSGDLVVLAACSAALPCERVIADETTVAWGPESGQFASLPSDGAPLDPPTMTARVGRNSLLASGHYYWREDLHPPRGSPSRQLRRVPFGGGEPEVVLNLDGIPDGLLMHDRGTLYWSNAFCDGDEENHDGINDGRRCVQQYRLR